MAHEWWAGEDVCVVVGIGINVDAGFRFRLSFRNCVSVCMADGVENRIVDAGIFIVSIAHDR